MNIININNTEKNMNTKSATLISDISVAIGFEGLLQAINDCHEVDSLVLTGTSKYETVQDFIKDVWWFNLMLDDDNPLFIEKIIELVRSKSIYIIDQYIPIPGQYYDDLDKLLIETEKVCKSYSYNTILIEAWTYLLVNRINMGTYGLYRDKYSRVIDLYYTFIDKSA